ncbi:MAG: hypothetical protein ABIP73_11290 [Gemmatimonadaceae bacterium]
MTADETKSLAGTTTVDEKVVFEAQRLSYDAARVIAEKIAFRISGRTRDQIVIIASTQLLADMSNLVAIKAVLEELAREYSALGDTIEKLPVAAHRSLVKDARSPAAIAATLSPALAAATAAVQSALTLVGLFRQDVDYKGVAITLDTQAFEIELAGRVRMHKAREVIVPDFAVFTAPHGGKGALLTLLAHVRSARSRVLLSAMEKDVEVEPDAKKESFISAVAEVDKRLNDLETQLTKSELDGSGLTLLARLFRVENLVAKSALFVHARVVLAGGSNRAQRSLWRSMFSGDGLSSTGGAVVTWAILSTHGSVEDGATFSHTMSAKSPKPPEMPPSIA